MTKYIIADSKGWYTTKKRVNRLNTDEVKVISKKEQLEYQSINKFKPRYIFFVHWNWKVSADIYNNFECIVFHTAPLPYGRGGSPIQNLIKEGFKKSPVSAIKMSEVIDGGPIYMQREVSLKGSLRKILNRIAKQIEIMITIIYLDSNIKPKDQKGEIRVFKRLTPYSNKLDLTKNLNGVYDQIRMVDALDYPRAFIIDENYKVEFKKAIIKKNKVKCVAVFKKKEFKKKKIYTGRLTFENVERNNMEQIDKLYKLLEKRVTGISHTQMPDYNEHVVFVQNNPYLAWYLVSEQGKHIGSTYILDNNCIGINLLAGHGEYINEVIKYIKKNHEPLEGIKSVRNDKFFVNIAKQDHEKRQKIEETGAKIIQYSYLIE